MLFLSKRNNGIYYVYYKNNLGKRACISTKCNKKSEALKFLSDFKYQLTERKLKKSNSITLDKCFFEFLKYSQTYHTKNTFNTYKYSFNVLLRHFGSIPLADLNQKTISEFIQDRIQNVSSRNANKMYATLSAVFKWGISMGYMTDNPMTAVRRPKVPEKQPLFFTEIDFSIFLREVTNPDLKDLICFAVNTGLRSGELIALTWEQIDFKNRFLILDNRKAIAKSKKVASVPLNLNAMQVLTDRQIKTSADIVFSYRNKPWCQKTICRKFKEYLIKAGLNPRLHFHSLRHTFASWLIQRRVPIYNISKLLRHSNIKTSEIYTHLLPDQLRESVEKLNN
jgi:integrase